VGGGTRKILPEGTPFTVEEPNEKGDIPIQPQNPVKGFEEYEFPSIAMSPEFVETHLTIDAQA
jgi:hypothetical protein